jgi:hypothetical protein
VLTDGCPVTPDRNSGPSGKGVAAAAIALGSAALSPAKANYDYCTENPSAKGCPGNFDVTNEPFYTPPHATRSAQHETHRAPRHHG